LLCASLDAASPILSAALLHRSPWGNSFSLEPLDLRLLGAGLGCGVTAQPNPGNRPDGRGAAMALSAEAKVPKGSILPDEFRPFSTISSPCARGPVWDPGKPLSCLRSPLTARKVPLRLRLLRLLMLVHETAFGLQVPLVMALRLRGGARDGGLELLGGLFGADDRQLTGDHRLLRRIGPGDCRKVSGHARQGPEHRVPVPALVAAFGGVRAALGGVPSVVVSHGASRGRVLPICLRRCGLPAILWSPLSGAGGQFRVQSGPLVAGVVFGHGVYYDVVAVYGRRQCALLGDAHRREDSFHAPSPAGEGRMDASVVVGSVPVGDRSGGAAIDGQYSAIDAGLGVERIGGDTLHEAEVEPRSPLRGHHGR